MKDNFNLKKFLVENKAIEKLNPYFKKETLNEGNLRKKVREMIINELNPDYADYDEMDDMGDDESVEARLGKDYIVDKEHDNYHNETPYEEETKEEEEEFWIDPAGGTHSSGEDDPAAMYLEEAKEEEEEEDVETEETEEDVETEEDADINSEDGLENVAADMEGDEGDLMNNLMGALKIAKGMNNEKLATQIGNTLKFFVSEYISDKE